MPIQIIQDDERLVYEMAGSRIFYRRISSSRRASIIRKHTKRGRVDWNAVTEEILQQVIIGWENVQSRGVDVPFSGDLIARLPEDILTDVLAASGGAGDEDEDAEKN